jgi:uncharacterized protein YehS (DUF1456 family)
MIAVFGLADHLVTREQISDWLKKDDDPAYQKFSDTQLAIFLNGLINDKRGKKEGPQPEPEHRLTNNINFIKLNIALKLKDEDPAFQKCSDTQLAIFLNGLINDKRGKKEGPQPEPEPRLNNNIIFRKLKIALNLKAEDILEIMDQAGLHISKHELSAFFRKPDHKHYRDCKDQILRNFLKGVQIKYRANYKL